jgi:release factor glutamine methyltransferase
MAEFSPNVRAALDWARQRGLDRHEAQTLVLHALGQPLHATAWLLAHDDAPLTAQAQAQLLAWAARRLASEPLAYITGQKAFYGLELRVDARVLDPRADTETLVDWALEVLPEPPQQRVLDLGTGSGAIALALQQARPHWQLEAIDRSADALTVARENAHRLHLPVRFHEGSWLTGFAGPVDAIVSNPPYIAATDPHLAALTHEPLQALASGSDGLDDLRQIVAAAGPCLVPGGWLLLEHGHDQAAAVRDLLHSAGFTQVQSRRDLAGIERCSGGQYP